MMPPHQYVRTLYFFLFFSITFPSNLSKKKFIRSKKIIFLVINWFFHFRQIGNWFVLMVNNSWIIDFFYHILSCSLIYFLFYPHHHYHHHYYYYYFYYFCCFYFHIYYFISILFLFLTFPGRSGRLEYRSLGIWFYQFSNNR